MTNLNRKKCFLQTQSDMRCGDKTNIHLAPKIIQPFSFNILHVQFCLARSARLMSENLWTPEYIPWKGKAIFSSYLPDVHWTY